MPAAKSKKFVIPAFRRAQRPGSFSGSLVFLLLLLSTNLFSQSLNFRNYSGEEILPSSTVYASFQDSKGYIWFATDHGVSRYDGYGFTQLSLKEGLADHEVFNFFEDSRGRIWFHTANGRVCYFKNGLMVSSVNDTKLAGLDSESYITGMCEDPQGNIWIATIRSGIIKYDEKKGVVRRYNLDDEDGKLIYALLWVGERLLVVTERNAITFRTGDEEIDVEKRKTIWPDIPAWGYPKCIDLQNGRVLISDYIAIIQYDLLTDEITTIQDSVSTYNLTQDQDHAWFCTITGALQYSKKQQKITGQILKDHKISSVLKDSEGNHWFTSLGDGIFYSTSPEVLSFTAKDGLPGKVNCLAKDAQNRIWIGYKEKNAISYV
ncbi:MAG: ligand-binding sensor domain-containing protein, partial [Bacteroidota bacterium]